MKKVLYTCLLAALVCAAAWGDPLPMDGSFLRQVQKRDSTLIADQLRYGIRLEGVPDGTFLALPDLKNGLCDSVEVLSGWQVDTVGRSRRGGTADIEISTLITSFEEGEYMLPSIPVVRTLPDGTVDTLLFNPKLLAVRTMPVDTATFVPHDIKGQIRYPLTLREVLPYLGLFYLVALAVIAAACLWMVHRKRTSGEVYHEPAYITALRKLDRLRGDKFWAPEKQKQFYSGITDTLREYIAVRYGTDAQEQTTAEVFEALRGSDVPEDLFRETKDLFELSDFVKFAKHVATPEENAAALPLAVRFVTTTWQEENPQESA